MAGKIHLKNGKVIQEKAAEEAVKDFIIYTQQRAKDLLEIIEPDDFIEFTDLVFESSALTTLFFFIFPISRTEPRFFSEIDNKETALALHELNLHFLAKGKSPNFFYACFVEMFTVVGMTAKIKESGVPGDFDTIMDEVAAHYCQERTFCEDEDASRIYVLTQWKALKVDPVFCCGTAEHNKRDAEMHFFGLGSEHRHKLVTAN
jgi:hypothetical protein